MTTDELFYGENYYSNSGCLRKSDKEDLCISEEYTFCAPVFEIEYYEMIDLADELEVNVYEFTNEYDSYVVFATNDKKDLRKIRKACLEYMAYMA